MFIKIYVKSDSDENTPEDFDSKYFRKSEMSVQTLSSLTRCRHCRIDRRSQSDRSVACSVNFRTKEEPSKVILITNYDFIWLLKKWKSRFLNRIWPTILDRLPRSCDQTKAKGMLFESITLTVRRTSYSSYGSYGFSLGGSFCRSFSGLFRPPYPSPFLLATRTWTFDLKHFVRSTTMLNKWGAPRRHCEPSLLLFWQIWIPFDWQMRLTEETGRRDSHERQPEVTVSWLASGCWDLPKNNTTCWKLSLTSRRVDDCLRSTQLSVDGRIQKWKERLIKEVSIFAKSTGGTDCFRSLASEIRRFNRSIVQTVLRATHLP